MIWQLIAILCGGGLFSLALVLASKNGSKAAQLEALKAELKKQAEAQAREARINNSIAGMSDERITGLLHEIATKQSKRMQ